MIPPAFPETLAVDWVPPVVVRRAELLARLVERLEPCESGSPVPRIAAVRGPSGSGTSTLARAAARELAERIRTRSTGPRLRVIAVRVRWCRGTLGVPTALLQAMDPGFQARGFPAAEILAGAIRRLAREGRPTLIVLDDLDPGGADVRPALRAFLRPDRFLPEGAEWLLPIGLLLAGSREGIESPWRFALERGARADQRLSLEPYSALELAEIVRDRLVRALGREPPGAWVESIAARAFLEGRGASRSMELLRRRLLGTSGGSLGSPYGPTGARASLDVEPRILLAIERARSGPRADLAQVREWEARLAREEGDSPLAATTFWRRIVRLESAGLIRREIRTGGPGGSRSIVELLEPVGEWARFMSKGGTPPTSGAWNGALPIPPTAEAAPGVRGRSTPAPPAAGRPLASGVEAG